MKKLIFLLFFLGLLGGGFAYLYLTDFRLVKKYVTPKIPEKVMGYIPEKVKSYIQDNETAPTLDELAPLEVPANKFDTQYVANDNPIFEAFRKGTKEDILKTIESTDNVDIFDVTGRTPLCRVWPGGCDPRCQLFLSLSRYRMLLLHCRLCPQCTKQSARPRMDQFIQNVRACRSLFHIS